MENCTRAIRLSSLSSNILWWIKGIINQLNIYFLNIFWIYIKEKMDPNRFLAILGT